MWGGLVAMTRKEEIEARKAEIRSEVEEADSVEVELLPYLESCCWE